MVCCQKKQNKYIKDVLLKDNDEVEALEEEHFNIHRRLYNHTEFTKIYPTNQFLSFSYKVVKQKK